MTARQDWFSIAQHILTDGEIEDALHQAVLRKAPERAGDISAWFEKLPDELILSVLGERADV